MITDVGGLGRVVHQTSRATLSCMLAISIALIPGGPASAQLSRADYEDCQARDEDGLRAALETVTMAALKRGTASTDYGAIVREKWRDGGLDAIVDARVDIAIGEVRDQTGWAELLQSLADSKKAQELATAVAERVYRSDALEKALEGLTVEVGREVAKSIEIASKDAAGPTVNCLKAFVGPRYGQSIAGIVGDDAGREFDLDPTAGGVEVTPGAVIKQTSGGIAGATILIVRRQLANMASRIGQRLVGSVLSRLVSVVAGGVGLVLIAKDIWELRNGVLPIISNEMKSKETKDKVQEELAKTIADQIGEHVKEISVASAGRILDVWREFRRAHVTALAVADKDAGFKAFLDTVKPETLPRLDEVVALVISEDGEAGLLRRLSDGTLNEAVNVASPQTLDIARDNRSLKNGLAWASLAGDKLPAVVAYGVHRRAQPEDFTRSSLAQLFAVDDKLAVTRLASIPRGSRDALFDLDASQLKTLARGLNEAELTTLASYLTGLEKQPRERVLATVAASPGKMQLLASPRIRDAIVASADQEAAVDMMLRPASTFEARQMFADAKLVWEGKVAGWLIWERHTSGLITAGALALLFLMWLRRLLFAGRRRDIAPPAPPTAAA